jgi:hypothetical protein
MFKFVIGLLITVTAIAALMLIPSQQTPAPMPWEIDILNDGNPKVFNIHLGTTRYSEVQQDWHVYGETAAFTEASQQTTVEAFFSSVHLGGLDAKVVLNLSVPESDIVTMLSTAQEAKIQPSGARKYILGNQSNKQLIDATVTSITYLPSVNLTPDMIVHRFGEASEKESLIDEETTLETKLWHYPYLGLTVQFKENEKTILMYKMLT